MVILIIITSDRKIITSWLSSPFSHVVISSNFSNVRLEFPPFNTPWFLYWVDKLQRTHNGFDKLILRGNVGTLSSKLGFRFHEMLIFWNNISKISKMFYLSISKTQPIFYMFNHRANFTPKLPKWDNIYHHPPDSLLRPDLL